MHHVLHDDDGVTERDTAKCYETTTLSIEQFGHGGFLTIECFTSR